MKNARQYSSISILLISLCAVVALLSNLGSSQRLLQYLFIARPGSSGLQDILSGQVWRLLTPIFIHFGFMHLLFNMIWVWDLGKLIEAKKGATFYAFFVVIVGVISNLAQYQFTHSPFFGGMSGVVYGLFGYIWIRGRVDPAFGTGLHKSTVIMMLAWFVLCWTGLLGPIANWAHTIGLVSGVVWGYLGGRSSDAVSSTAMNPHEQEPRLEYLSTSDMLKLESQRQWAREQYSPDARHRYDTIDGKLGIIEATLNAILAPGLQGQSSAADTAMKLQSLDIAFGDALVQKLDAQWATLDDPRGKRAVLVIAENPMIVFPLATISNLANQSGPVDVRRLFEDTIHSITAQTNAGHQ